MRRDENQRNGEYTGFGGGLIAAEAAHTAVKHHRTLSEPRWKMYLILRILIGRAKLLATLSR
ncbi:hypothetical protein DDT54_00535 [Brenneria nigrifluens DSM 30175 = ATCC 13028]|uniref:Uncharacterized protein n=1 Tax=Brenneria nigrifluens DSM 30175 = ATCC 13028 TaxID=1121120 RepID=A0A2U1UVZ5_9GAMM|nr:hypothetical protein DDT54_00535 [Brenneria nigrifluens DSM 30175 = ATCC 13028]